MKELTRFGSKDGNGPRPSSSSLSSQALEAVNRAHSELGTDVDWAKSVSKKVVGEWNERTEKLILLRMGEEESADGATMEGEESADDTAMERTDDEQTPIAGAASHNAGELEALGHGNDGHNRVAP